MNNLKKLLEKFSSKNLVRKISLQILAIVCILANLTALNIIKASPSHSNLTTSQTPNQPKNDQDTRTDSKSITKNKKIWMYGASGVAGAGILATLVYSAHNMYKHRGWTPLHHAAARGDKTKFKNLTIDVVKQINTVDDNCSTPLNIALQNDHPEILTTTCDQLFSPSSPVHSYNEKLQIFTEMFSTLLSNAIYNKDIDAIETLLTENTLKSYVKTYINCTVTGTADSVLDIALENKSDPAIIGLLIHHGASCNHHIVSISERNKYEALGMAKYPDCFN